MVRDRVRMSCSMTVFSNSSAALPVAAPRGIGIAAWGWSGQRRSPIGSRVRNLVRRLDWVQVGYHSALFSCGVAFGLLVGGFVGYMENATPHAGTTESLAQVAASDVQWATMMGYSRATSTQYLQRIKDARGVSPVGFTRVWWTSELAASVPAAQSLTASQGRNQAGGNHGENRYSGTR